jgi:hypothetical protein
MTIQFKTGCTYAPLSSYLPAHQSHTTLIPNLLIACHLSLFQLVSRTLVSSLVLTVLTSCPSFLAAFLLAPMLGLAHIWA